MCASVYSSLLLLTFATISLIFGSKMATEGLPRQERGADRGLLAGADFLSVIMGSSLRHAHRQATTAEPEPTTADRRAIRSTRPQDSSSESGVVVAVRVSSSVGRTLINKVQTTTEPADLNFVASEEHPSIVAEANKSEFSVEESEPITTNGDFLGAYPASVQPIPRPFGFDEEEKLRPIQQTVIYHNGPRDSNRARSVSYSTVIQAVPNSQIEKHWEDEGKHERRERHFDGGQTFNNLQEEKVKVNDTKSFPGEDNINQYVTSNLHTTLPKNDLTWQKEETSTRKSSFTTERNWELQEKHFAHLPTIYAKPEQNYEVDESASVMTNGRLHGVQPSPTLPSKQEGKVGESKKTDDNQKVGYVVEGRNYRKYRVEERTSDGFIVGEYGVVSHDDGSLRGVRYTADGTISPRLIYDALMKFLSL